MFLIVISIKRDTNAVIANENTEKRGTIRYDEPTDCHSPLLLYGLYLFVHYQDTAEKRAAEPDSRIQSGVRHIIEWPA